MILGADLWSSTVCSSSGSRSVVANDVFTLACISVDHFMHAASCLIDQSSIVPWCRYAFCLCLLHPCFPWAVRTHHVALVPAVWVGVCASMRVPPAFLITGLAAATALLIRPACMSACLYALTSSCLHRSQGPRAWQARLGPGRCLLYTLCPRTRALVWCGYPPY